MTDQPIPPAPRNTGKSNSTTCLVVGCSVVGGLVLVAIIGTFIAIGVFGEQLAGMVIEEFTTTEPIEMPEVDMAEDEYAALRERVDLFGERLDKGEPAPALELTADEINALFQKHPEFENMPVIAYVRIEDNRIKGDVSVPVDKFVPGIEAAAGRYINGSGTFTASLSNGQLEVYADQLSWNGEAIPEPQMSQFRQENLAADAMNDPEARAFFDKLDSISVEDEKLVLVPKNLAGDTTPESTDDEAAPAEQSPV